MKKLFTIILLVLTVPAMAQKKYVWCPENINAVTRPVPADLDTIHLVIFDSRSIASSDKVECSSDQIISAITHTIKTAYSTVTVASLSSDQYYKASAPGRFTVKVGLSEYSASALEGRWSARSRLDVVIDGSGDKDGTSHVIAKSRSKGNTGGFRTARNLLNQTFEESVNDLLLFIDRTIITTP